jgi:hypothetical protein
MTFMKEKDWTDTQLFHQVNLSLTTFKIYFVSEYCLKPQMALLTVPGEEGRTMVGPLYKICCWLCRIMANKSRHQQRRTLYLMSVNLSE